MSLQERSPREDQLWGETGTNASSSILLQNIGKSCTSPCPTGNHLIAALLRSPGSDVCLNDCTALKVSGRRNMFLQL